MFRRIDDATSPSTVEISVDGRPVVARDGATLALALLEAGMTPLRHSAVSGEPRAPLCLMGTCFECLVQVDGQPNVQACMVAVRPGMQVRRAQGARALEPQS